MRFLARAPYRSAQFLETPSAALGSRQSCPRLDPSVDLVSQSTIRNNERAQFSGRTDCPYQKCYPARTTLQSATFKKMKQRPRQSGDQIAATLHWVGTKHRRVDFNCPEGATFSQPRLRKSVDRYASRNENSALVVLRNPLKSEGYQGRSPWLVGIGLSLKI